ncbi:hypothetical protein GCM10007972_04250 [Iodidimonas muriae]|uniref:Magnesium transporter MgtE intracellular domain-containing protein n=1 Tax=Iodidimonas muriae TaxID=261467 RepID=A0ABQ2L7W1_9PROT|nr:hypothetical protein [Iodidimonas muriae]GER08132.1 hypothetical protein JCM17843_24420 [Kordiimonadales bacterium JCM 17843]GGO06186.1 hypothetical protein GCM10007972_04250 [Iodidimonas muriae]
MSGQFLSTVSAYGKPRLLPVFILTASVVLAAKTGTLLGDVTRLVTEASAQENAASTTTAPAQDEGAPATLPKDQSAQSGAAEEAGSSAVRSSPTLGGVSRSEMDLLQDLRKRRQQLEEREQQAALREQLLASTERRIDQKISQLRSIEQEISVLVTRHEEQENEQIDSIVKVYETMKPKDAASIFERLDMDIQQQVATRMSDRKMAALLAEMDTDAARILTTRLATTTRLPDVEDLVGQKTAP